VPDDVVQHRRDVPDRAASGIFPEKESRRRVRLALALAGSAVFLIKRP